MTEKHSQIGFGRFVGLWTERILLGAVVLCVATYAVDIATYFLRGQPVDHVAVNRTLAIPLKGNKTEFEYEGTDILSCSQSIFPQAGKTPCWYMRQRKTHIDQL
jgi:hypothetical protein